MRTNVKTSGIWINTVNASDHCGIPYAIIILPEGEAAAYKLQGVREIKALNIKTKTDAELSEFTDHMECELKDGTIRLINVPDRINQVWIEKAIHNLMTSMYKSAKNKWGETSQTRKQLNRSVCINKTNRCRGQVKAVLKTHKYDPIKPSEIKRVIGEIKWPKWVRESKIMPNQPKYIQKAALLWDHIRAGSSLMRGDESGTEWFENVFK